MMNQVLKEILLPAGVTLQLVQGDLTEERVDAIVNAANAHLQHGGGVAEAISSRGGSRIQTESDAWVDYHQAFAAALRAGQTPPVTGEDGRKAIEVVLAIYRAAETGQPVTLPM